MPDVPPASGSGARRRNKADGCGGGLRADCGGTTSERYREGRGFAAKEPDDCVVPDLGQCSGAPYDGCTACGSGSACVYVNETVSVCLPGYSTTVAAEPCAMPLDDGAQCGGRGYAGCQQCRPESQCVPRTPWKSVCVAGDGKSLKEEAATKIDDDDLMKFEAWVRGIDPTLEADLQSMSLLRGAGGNATVNTTAFVDSNAIRRRISKAFASSEGLQQTRDLMQSSTEFQSFNHGSAAALQESLCAMIHSSTSLVSGDVRECVCGNTDKPFVHCVALLEQELHRHLEDLSAATVDHRPSRTIARKLPTCAVTFQGVNLKDRLVRYASAVAQQVSDWRNFSSSRTGPAEDVCLGGRCSVPNFPLPLEATFGVEACASGFGLSKDDVGKITDLDVRRAAAARTMANIYAGFV